MGPINLPEGSVRSYLTLGLVFTVCALSLARAGVPSELNSLASAALGYYVATRQQQTPPPTAPTGTA